MPDQAPEDALSSEDLARQTGDALPDREAMSTITPSGIDNFAMPINEALAVNIDSVESYAIADADQIVVLNQVDVVGADDPAADDGGPGHGRPDHSQKP